MRSIKIKLLSFCMAMCLVVTFLIVGIWAVGTQTINLKGNVDFTITDPSLYVKDIRLKNSMEDTSSTGETIANFVPGYVNTTMNLNLGQIDNTTGGLSIYIDIINTTDTTYVASTPTSITGAEITVSGTINGDAIPQGDILTTDTPSGTVEIVISAPGIATLDLSQLSILLEEQKIGYTVTITYNKSHNGTLYVWTDVEEQIQVSYGETKTINGNVLSLSFNPDAPSSSFGRPSSVTLPEVQLGEYSVSYDFSTGYGYFALSNVDDKIYGSGGKWQSSSYAILNYNLDSDIEVIV